MHIFPAYFASHLPPSAALFAYWKINKSHRLSRTKMASKASRWSPQWFRPEILPLFLTVGTGLGISGFAVVRNFAINPDVRLNKEDRKAGILENYEEGQSYQEHSFRTLLRDRRPEIMPSFNDFLSKPK